MAWKRIISTFLVTNLVCCAGVSQESKQGRELRQKIRVESNIVVLTVTVKGGSDRLVPGLVKEDFHVFDDDVEQNILSFTDESLPLSLLILVDDDLKWKEGTQMARSVRSIIGDIADQDEAMVCRFDMLFYPGDEFTSDSLKLIAALKSAQLLQQRPSDRRRIILMLTDGLNEPKLNHHSHEAVRDFLLQDNISVYPLVSGSGK